MADRGAQAPVPEAPSINVDTYQHVQEPAADFGNTAIGVYYGPW